MHTVVMQLACQPVGCFVCLLPLFQWEKHFFRTIADIGWVSIDVMITIQVINIKKMSNAKYAMKCIHYVYNLKINKIIIMCYANHSQVLVSKYFFFQVRDVFIAGCGHQIFKFGNVTQIQGIVIWCRCVIQWAWIWT